jgi:hypothetical protein
MSPELEAGNWKPYGVPEMISLLPLLTPMQQLPLTKCLIRWMPPFAL